MAGLGVFQNIAGNLLGDVADTLLSEVAGASSGIIYRSAPTAGRLLGVGSENYAFHTASAPRPGFLYMVKFITPLNASSTRTGFDASSQLSSKTGFTFQAKSVDRPNTTIQTEVVNQYNKKRVIYTGRTHNPVSITFYDDIAGKLLKFWQSYFAHYFQDGVIASNSQVFWDLMANTINDPATGGFGLRTIPGTDEKYYFEKIIIYQFFGGYYTTITLFNPVISSFQYSNPLSYAGTSDTLTEVNVTFEYENVAYNMDPVKISTSEATDFGFQFDYNNPPLGISTQRVAGYLDAFLQKNGIADSISSVISDTLGLGNTTTGKIADSVLKSMITSVTTNNTSKSTKNGILEVGINAFSDLISSNVSFNANKNQSTTGAFPLSSQYSDNGHSAYSTQMGNIASKLLGTGLYSQLSTKASQIDSNSFKSNSLIVTNPTGEVQFTQKGLAGVNSLVSQSTVFGVSSKTVTNVASSVGTAVKAAKALKGLFG